MVYPDSRILLVDDERQVLDALSELLQPLGCQLFMTQSPRQGFEILGTESIDVVISDMRMPEMGGDCFLEQVAKQWPATERIVMTGHADAQASIDAINRGKISRFLLKPWDDAEVISAVEKCLQLSDLTRKNVALQALTQQKNAELARLNRSLEETVQRRTEQLKQANENLKQSYRSIVRMFSTLTARRLGIRVSDNNLRLNRMLLGVAQGMGIEGKPLKQLFYAWQLRHIGKLSFADDLLKVAYVKLSADQQRLFHSHPRLAHAATLLVKPLYPAGQIILQHKEYLDGSGYPKGLKAAQISLSAQVLCVVNDYVELINGSYQPRPYSTDEALRYLKQVAVERYNQQVVTILEQVIQSLAEEGQCLNDACLSSLNLTPGMILSRDLISQEGILLLSGGQPLDALSIERVRELEFNLEEVFEIYVKN